MEVAVTTGIETRCFVEIPKWRDERPFTIVGAPVAAFDARCGRQWSDEYE
jgi:hypothetical protein